MKFDDILQNYVGEFGRYQKRIYVLVCLPAVAAAIFTMLPVFILATPDHRCHIPGLENDTYSIQSKIHELYVNASIPREEDVDSEMAMSQCHLYKYSNSNNESLADLLSRNATSRKKEKEKCSAWVYDKSMVTAITQFDMVCDDAILQSHFKMISFFGALLGSFVNGITSDLFGRKLVFLVCLGIYLVATICLLASPYYAMFLAMRFLQGAAGIGVFMISFVMVMELVGPSHRMFAGMVIELFWCAGLFILVVAAYFIRTWIYLILTVSLPCLLFFMYIWVIPESPRWLLSRGKVEKAEAILQKAAKENGSELPERLLEDVVEEENKSSGKSQESGQVWKLFCHKVLLVRMVILIFNRFALNMTYYGLSLNVEHLSGNLFLNFTISSAVETLGVSFILLFIKRLGRKPLYCSSMIISAIGFLTSILPIYFGGKSDYIYALSLTMVGKFGTSAAYAVVYVYLSELVPTSLRNSALGVSLCFEVFGGVVSPYIVDVGNHIGGKTSQAFPMIIYGSVSLTAGLLSLLLPETKDKQLPETVDDAVKFGRVEAIV